MQVHSAVATLGLQRGDNAGPDGCPLPLSRLHSSRCCRRLSEVPAMQVRDAATTLGLLFAAMGVGAVLGPFIFNPFTPPKWAFLSQTRLFPASAATLCFCNVLARKCLFAPCWGPLSSKPARRRSAAFINGAC